MRSIVCIIALLLTATLARADDMAAMISQYRREHGLPAVKIDPRLTAVAERQARAMAAAGVMEHDVDGPFSSRIAGANVDAAGENIAAGTKSWEETLRAWKASPGHNANLLLGSADSLGIAVARNDATRYKTFWAMVIGHKETPRRGQPERLRAVAASHANPSGAEPSGAAGPGLLDSLGTALKRITDPVRNLWN